MILWASYRAQTRQKQKQKARQSPPYPGWPPKIQTKKKPQEYTNKCWPRGSTGVQRYGCIPRSAANNSGEIPQKLGALNPLFWRIFLGREHIVTRPCLSPSHCGIRLYFYAPTSPPPKWPKSKLLFLLFFMFFVFGAIIGGQLGWGIFVFLGFWRGFMCSVAQKCLEGQRLPKGTWNDNSHEATQNLMHILQRLCSFWLVTSRSLHVAVVARFYNSRLLTIVGSQLL